MPARHIPRVSIPNFDKVVHTSIYTILAVLTYCGWMMQRGFGRLHHSTLLKVIVLLALYGLTIEIMQETLTTDRHFEWLDELANTSGAVIGALTGKQILAWLKIS
jgi:VanZ family protein